MEYMRIYWEDLTPEAQKRLFDFLGDNGNYDVFPIAVIRKPDPDDVGRFDEDCG